MLLCIVLTVGISVVALVGDLYLQLFQESWLRALSDSLIHGLIGALSWATVVFGYSLRNWDLSGNRFVDTLYCGLFATAIDLDHLLVARSLELKKYKFDSFSVVPWILAVAVITHHVRDATRRGLWLWPFGSTRPIQYTNYVAFLALFPHILHYFISNAILPKNRHPISPSVV